MLLYLRCFSDQLFHVRLGYPTATHQSVSAPFKIEQPYENSIKRLDFSYNFQRLLYQTTCKRNSEKNRNRSANKVTEVIPRNSSVRASNEIAKRKRFCKFRSLAHNMQRFIRPSSIAPCAFFTFHLSNKTRACTIVEPEEKGLTMDGGSERKAGKRATIGERRIEVRVER